MVLRYPVAAFLAAAITFTLLYAMQSLVAGGRASIEESPPRWELDFVRLKRSEDLNRRQREKPTKLDRPQPPPPSASSVENQGPAEIEVDISIQAAALDIGLGDGPYLGGGADGDVVPMVRVNPQYPQRASARGIEGWVHLRFTVTKVGTTNDIQVVGADPRGYFETAAKSAVKRYKYKPKVENGEAVVRPGVEVVLSFELEK